LGQKGKWLPLALSTSSKFPLIFEYREEGLFNLQICVFLCHSEIHEKEKFSTGPTCHPPTATCLLTLAALRYFPPPHCSCSHMLSPYLFPTTPCSTKQPAYTSVRAHRVIALQSRSSSTAAHLLATHSLASMPWSRCSFFLCHCQAMPELCRGRPSPSLVPEQAPGL
jgi:hypothetical protein